MATITATASAALQLSGDRLLGQLAMEKDCLVRASGFKRKYILEKQKRCATGALALAEDRLGESLPSTLASGHLALIEATYRASFVMSMLDKERLLDGDTRTLSRCSSTRLATRWRTP